MSPEKCIGVMGRCDTTEVKVLRPRLVPLGAEQRREAVALLAEVLLDVARKRRDSVSSSVSDGGSGGAIAGVGSLPTDEGKGAQSGGEIAPPGPPPKLV